MPSNKKPSTNSFQEIAAALGFDTVNEGADWYLQRNDTIPDPRRDHFDEANPSGAHPVLLLDTAIRESDPPLTIYRVWIRSAHCRSPISHPKHAHVSRKACLLNNRGWIVAHSMYPIFKRDLLNLFCSEDPQSPLLPQLRQRSQHLPDWW